MVTKKSNAKPDRLAIAKRHAIADSRDAAIYLKKGGRKSVKRSKS